MKYNKKMGISKGNYNMVKPFNPQSVSFRDLPTTHKLAVIHYMADECSAPQPYNVLNVVGLNLSENVRSGLSEFGLPSCRSHY